MVALRVLKLQTDSNILLTQEDLTGQVQIFTRLDQRRAQLRWEATQAIFRKTGIKGLAYLSQLIMKKFFLSIEYCSSICHKSES